MRVLLLSEIPAPILAQVVERLRSRNDTLIGIVTCPGQVNALTPGAFEEMGERVSQYTQTLGPDPPPVLVVTRFSQAETWIEALRPDVLVSVPFWYKVSKRIISMPNLRCVNYHPAPLPLYRGPDPLGSALRDKVKRWSFCWHDIDAEYDTGAVLARQDIDVPSDASADWMLANAVKAALGLLPEVLEKVRAGVRGTPQMSVQDALSAGEQHGLVREWAGQEEDQDRWMRTDLSVEGALRKVEISRQTKPFINVNGKMHRVLSASIHKGALPSHYKTSLDKPGDTWRSVDQCFMRFADGVLRMHVERV